MFRDRHAEEAPPAPANQGKLGDVREVKGAGEGWPAGVGRGRGNASGEGVRLVEEYVLDEQDGGQNEGNQLQRVRKIAHYE